MVIAEIDPVVGSQFFQARIAGQPLHPVASFHVISGRAYPFPGQTLQARERCCRRRWTMANLLRQGMNRLTSFAMRCTVAECSHTLIRPAMLSPEIFSITP